MLSLGLVTSNGRQIRCSPIEKAITQYVREPPSARVRQGHRFAAVALAIGIDLIHIGLINPVLWIVAESLDYRGVPDKKSCCLCQSFP